MRNLFLLLLFILIAIFAKTSHSLLPGLLSSRYELVIDPIALRLQLTTPLIAGGCESNGQGGVFFKVIPTVCLHITTSLSLIETSVIVSKSNCSDFDEPQIRCEMVTQYQYDWLLTGSYAPILNYDCSTFSSKNANTFGLCDYKWTPETQDIVVLMRYYLEATNAALRQPKNSPEINSILTETLYTKVPIVYELIPNDLKPLVSVAGTCKLCDPLLQNCDYLYSFCPNIDVLCEKYNTSTDEEVLCTDFNAVGMSTEGCAVDNLPRRSKQTITGCKVPNTNPDTMSTTPYIHTFKFPDNIGACNDPTKISIHANAAHAVPVTNLATFDFITDCPTELPKFTTLYCGMNPCPTSTKAYCAGKCQEFDVAVTRCTVIQDGSPLVDTTDMDNLRESTYLTVDEQLCKDALLDYEDSAPEFCTSGCTIDWTCLLTQTDTLSIAPYGPCTPDIIRRYIATQTDQCTDSAVIENDKLVLFTIRGPNGHVLGPISLGYHNVNQNSVGHRWINALGIQNGPELMMPIYSGCTKAEVVCHDLYGSPTDASAELCNKFANLGTNEQIATLRTGRPVYSTDEFQCSQTSCQYGSYIIVPRCRYIDSNNNPLAILPLTSFGCIDAVRRNLIQIPTKLTATCLNLDTSCPPQYRCTLGNDNNNNNNNSNDLIPTTTACSTNVCRSRLGDPTCSPPLNTPLTLTGSRTIEGCYFNGNKILQNQYCPSTTPTTSFFCTLPTCPSILPTLPIIPQLSDLSVYQKNQSTQILQRVKQAKESSNVATPDDVDGISMNHLIQIVWNYQEADHFDHIGYIEAQFDNQIFPTPIMSVTLSTKYASIDIQTNPAFKLLNWSTLSQHSVVFSLRIKGSTFKTNEIKIFSVCSSNHLAQLICQPESTSPLYPGYNTGRCNAIRQSCECLNGWYGPQCGKQLCSKDRNDSSVECGPSTNTCEIQYRTTGDIFDPLTQNNDVVTSLLGAKCNCASGFSGTNCQISTTCSSLGSSTCSNGGFIETFYSYTKNIIPYYNTHTEALDNEVEIATSISCASDCTCASNFFSPLDNCSTSSLQCQNESTINATNDGCECKPGTYGLMCQCKSTKIIRLEFNHRPESWSDIVNLWHTSLLSDIQSDTGLDAQRFIFLNESIITNTTNTEQSWWVVYYDIIECDDDNYDGVYVLGEAPQEEPLSSVLSPLSPRTYAPTPLSSFAALPSSFSLPLSTLSTMSMDPITENTTNDYHFMIQQTTLDQLNAQWDQLAKLPPDQKGKTYTHTGPASGAAGNLTGIDNTPLPPIVSIDDPNDKDGNDNMTIIIILIAVLVPCVIFIIVLILLFVCRNRQKCCWDPEFKAKQERHLGTFQDENGIVIQPTSNPQTQTQSTKSITSTEMTTPTSSPALSSAPLQYNSHPTHDHHHLPRSGRSDIAERSEFSHVNYRLQRKTSETRPIDSVLDLDIDTQSRNTSEPDSNGRLRNVSSSPAVSCELPNSSSALPTLVSMDQSCLPSEPGWLQLRNSDGKVYWYHAEKMETSWIHPDKINPNRRLATMGFAYPSPDENDDEVSEPVDI